MFGSIRGKKSNKQGTKPDKDKEQSEEDQVQSESQVTNTSSSVESMEEDTRNLGRLRRDTITDKDYDEDEIYAGNTPTHSPLQPRAASQTSTPNSAIQTTSPNSAKSQTAKSPGNQSEVQVSPNPLYKSTSQLNTKKVDPRVVHPTLRNKPPSQVSTVHVEETGSVVTNKQNPVFKGTQTMLRRSLASSTGVERSLRGNDPYTEEWVDTKLNKLNDLRSGLKGFIRATNIDTLRTLQKHEISAAFEKAIEEYLDAISVLSLDPIQLSKLTKIIFSQKLMNVQELLKDDQNAFYTLQMRANEHVNLIQQGMYRKNVIDQFNNNVPLELDLEDKSKLIKIRDLKDDGNYGVVSLYQIKDEKLLKLLRDNLLIPQDKNEIAIKMMKGVASTEDFVNESKIVSILHQNRYKNPVSFYNIAVPALAISKKYNLETKKEEVVKSQIILTRFETFGSAFDFLNKLRIKLSITDNNALVATKKDTVRFTLNTLNSLFVGLLQIQKLNLIHKDISGTNILIDKDQMVKFADFAKGIEIPENEIFVKGNPQDHLQYNRMDADARLFLRFSKVTDLYSFKIAILELIAALGGIEQNQFRAAIKWIVPDQQSENANADMLRSSYRSVKNAILSVQESNPSPSNQIVLNLLHALQPFLLEWRPELNPTQQMKVAYKSLSHQLKNIQDQINLICDGVTIIPEPISVAPIYAEEVKLSDEQAAVNTQDKMTNETNRETVSSGQDPSIEHLVEKPVVAVEGSGYFTIDHQPFYDAQINQKVADVQAQDDIELAAVVQAEEIVSEQKEEASPRTLKRLEKVTKGEEKNQSVFGEFVKDFHAAAADRARSDSVGSKPPSRTTSNAGLFGSVNTDKEPQTEVESLGASKTPANKGPG